MKTTTKIVIITLTLARPILLAAATWPFFKGDLFRSSIAVGTSLSAPLELKWKGIIGSGKTVTYSSPVIGANRVYIGSTDGHLYGIPISPNFTSAFLSN